MTDCTTLDRMITPYLDGAVTPMERDAIAAHFQSCRRCRERVAAEAAARRVLRAHVASARSLGEPPAFTPRVARLGKPSLLVEYRGTIAAVLIAAATTAGVVLSRPTPVAAIEAVGIIGDSRCGLHHRLSEPYSPDERSCTLNCVKRGARFVLLADGVVYPLRNQDFPGLSSYAGTRVVVSGQSGDGGITLSHVAIAPDTQALYMPRQEQTLRR